MKEMKKLLYAAVCLLGMTALYSCNEKPEPEPGPTPPAITGQTIMVPNEANAVVEVSMEMESEWEISNSNTWFTVNPLSGAAGPVNFKITVLENNPELTEKVAWFVIRRDADDPGKAYYVVQDVTPGMTPGAVTSASFNIDGGESSFTIQSNLAIEAIADADWITVGDITSDSVLLADEATYSKYKTYTVNFSVSANDGNARDGYVTVNGIDSVATDIAETFLVQQYGTLAAPDYSKDFIRRSLVVRYTGNWCGYCPVMNVALHDAIDQYPDHIVQMNMYQGSGSLSYPDINAFMNHFGIIGFPTSIFNYYAEVGNQTSTAMTTERFVNLAKEAVAKVPARTILGGYAALIDTTEVQLELGIAAKEEGEYYLNVFLLEDNIIGSQSDYVGVVENPSQYNHSSVMRAQYNEDMFGDPIQLSASSFDTMNLTLAIPSGIEDVNNLRVVVFTTYEGSFSGEYGSNYVQYNNYGYVVDNAVSIPVNGFAVFGYEN